MSCTLCLFRHHQKHISASKDSFFLSTTPFCCGVVGAKKFCKIPFSSQKVSKTIF